MQLHCIARNVWNESWGWLASRLDKTQQGFMRLPDKRLLLYPLDESVVGAFIFQQQQGDVQRTCAEGLVHRAPPAA